MPDALYKIGDAVKREAHSQTEGEATRYDAGVIVAVTTHANEPTQYQIEYQNPDGSDALDWWPEDDIIA